MSKIERFAKRKLKLFPGYNDFIGDCVRVFFCFDSGEKIHLDDYPRCYSKEVIYELAKKKYYEKRGEQNGTK